MASNRKSKDIAGSGSGASSKQSTVRNHGVEFKDPEQKNRYKSLISRTISPCRYLDVNAMDRLGIDEHVISMLNMDCTIWGRKKVRMMRTDELFMLRAMLYNLPVNIFYYLFDYLVSLSKKNRMIKVT